MSFDCPHCGKTHRKFTTLDACAVKHQKTECVCPRYWRRLWSSHSFMYGCPLAK